MSMIHQLFKLIHPLKLKGTPLRSGRTLKDFFSKPFFIVVDVCRTYQSIVVP